MIVIVAMASADDDADGRRETTVATMKKRHVTRRPRREREQLASYGWVFAHQYCSS